MIIVVEGIDRVGKTTLCDMIEERYRNVLDFMRFRDDTRYAHSHGDRLVNTEKINTLQNLMEAGKAKEKLVQHQSAVIGLVVLKALFMGI